MATNASKYRLAKINAKAERRAAVETARAAPKPERKKGTMRPVPKPGSPMPRLLLKPLPRESRQPSHIARGARRREARLELAAAKLRKARAAKQPPREKKPKPERAVAKSAELYQPRERGSKNRTRENERRKRQWERGIIRSNARPQPDSGPS